MELNKKKYIIILPFIFLAVSVYQKYQQRITFKNIYGILLNEKNVLEDQYLQIIKKNIKEKEHSEYILNKINNMNITLNPNILKNETDFKKIIYLFSYESGLDLYEISKAELIWRKENYSLKYISFTFQGDLAGITKFLYLINKSKVYIDMTKSYIELTKDSFKISLGYLENNLNKSREEDNE